MLICSHLGSVIDLFNELVLLSVRLCLALDGKVFDLSWSVEALCVELSSFIVTRFLSTLLTGDVMLFDAVTLLKSESESDLNGWCDVCWIFVAIFDVLKSEIDVKLICIYSFHLLNS